VYENYVKSASYDVDGFAHNAIAALFFASPDLGYLLIQFNNFKFGMAASIFELSTILNDSRIVANYIERVIGIHILSLNRIWIHVNLKQTFYCLSQSLSYRAMEEAIQFNLEVIFAKAVPARGTMSFLQLALAVVSLTCPAVELMRVRILT
jgi:hypothetical protein